MEILHSIQKVVIYGGVKQYFNFLIQQDERADNPAEFIQLKGLKRKTLYDILNRQELDNLYHHYKMPDEQSKDKNQKLV